MTGQRRGMIIVLGRRSTDAEPHVRFRPQSVANVVIFGSAVPVGQTLQYTRSELSRSLGAFCNSSKVATSGEILSALDRIGFGDRGSFTDPLIRPSRARRRCPCSRFGQGQSGQPVNRVHTVLLPCGRHAARICDWQKALTMHWREAGLSARSCPSIKNIARDEWDKLFPHPTKLGLL